MGFFEGIINWFGTRDTIHSLNVQAEQIDIYAAIFKLDEVRQHYNAALKNMPNEGPELFKKSLGYLKLELKNFNPSISEKIKGEEREALEKIYSKLRKLCKDYAEYIQNNVSNKKEITLEDRTKVLNYLASNLFAGADKLTEAVA